MTPQSSLLKMWGRLPLSQPWPLLVAALCLPAIYCELYAATPPGRAWAPAQDLDIPGVAVFGSARLFIDSSDNLRMVVGARWHDDSLGRWNIFSWAETEWTSAVRSDVMSGYPPWIATEEPATPDVYFAYIGEISYPDGYRPLLLGRATDSSVLLPDTSLKTTTQSYDYAAAVGSQRKWVARCDQVVNGPLRARLAYADTLGVWHELPTPPNGLDAFHCTVAPLDDSTALFVYAGWSGLYWSVASGSTWLATGTLDPRGTATHPRLRRKPSGGWWLMYANFSHIVISRFENGAWMLVDSLACDRDSTERFATGYLEVSTDDNERPVIAWNDQGAGQTFRDRVCVACATDSGWLSGAQVPGSGASIFTPTVAVDRNGDTWTCWRVRTTNTNRWSHTYVTAVPTNVQVAGAGPTRIVSWHLSEAAPRSWWGVLRAKGGGVFSPIARVRAGMDSVISWVDVSPPTGILQYKIRREHVNAAYRLESEPVQWPSGAQAPLRWKRVPVPASDSATIELVGAAPGTVKLSLHDLVGRVVSRAERQAGGTGRDVFAFSFFANQSPLPAGVYFLRAVDASGTASEAAKLVVLR